MVCSVAFIEECKLNPSLWRLVNTIVVQFSLLVGIRGGYPYPLRSRPPRDNELGFDWSRRILYSVRVTLGCYSAVLQCIEPHGCIMRATARWMISHASLSRLVLWRSHGQDQRSFGSVSRTPRFSDAWYADWSSERWLILSVQSVGGSHQCHSHVYVWYRELDAGKAAVHRDGEELCQQPIQCTLLREMEHWLECWREAAHWQGCLWAANEMLLVWTISKVLEPEEEGKSPWI